LGQQGLIFIRSRLGADKRPPRNPLVFRQPPFWTTRQQYEEAVDKKQNFVIGNSDAAEDAM
jgi:hypothetical protein